MHTYTPGRRRRLWAALGSAALGPVAKVPPAPRRHARSPKLFEQGGPPEHAPDAAGPPSGRTTGLSQQALTLAALPGTARAIPGGGPVAGPGVAVSTAGVPDRPAPGPVPDPVPDPTLPVHALAAGDAPLDNPLKGFARFYQPGGDQNTGCPHSLTWSYFGLSEVMKDASDCGRYDWSALDDSLDAIAAAGNQAAVRFYMEYPGGSGSHPADAIPSCFAGHVNNRDNAYWGTTSPDYDSPRADDGADRTLSFAPTADWNTTGTTTVRLDLRAGTDNTVTLANADGWAPDIDRITVN